MTSLSGQPIGSHPRWSTASSVPRLPLFPLCRVPCSRVPCRVSYAVYCRGPRASSVVDITVCDPDQTAHRSRRRDLSTVKLAAWGQEILFLDGGRQTQS